MNSAFILQKLSLYYSSLRMNYILQNIFIFIYRYTETYTEYLKKKKKHLHLINTNCSAFTFLFYWLLTVSVGEPQKNAWLHNRLDNTQCFQYVALCLEKFLIKYERDTKYRLHPILSNSLELSEGQ